MQGGLFVLGSSCHFIEKFYCNRPLQYGVNREKYLAGSSLTDLFDDFVLFPQITLSPLSGNNSLYVACGHIGDRQVIGCGGVRPGPWGFVPAHFSCPGAATWAIA